MKYKEFLNENSMNDLINMFLENCTKYDLDEPFIRGTRKLGFIRKVTKKERESITGGNMANIIVDHLIGDHPKRNQSNIFTTYSGRHHANRFNHLHVIIPFDNCKFSYCEAEDFNYIDVPELEGEVGDISMILSVNGIEGKSYDEIINKIYEKSKKASENDYLTTELFKNIKSKEDVDKQMRQIFNLNKLGIKFTDNLNSLKGKTREIWTDGDCLLVDYTRFDAFKKMIEERKKKD